MCCGRAAPSARLRRLCPEWVRIGLQTARSLLCARDSFSTNLVVRVCLSHGGRPFPPALLNLARPHPGFALEFLSRAGMVLAANIHEKTVLRCQMTVLRPKCDYECEDAMCVYPQTADDAIVYKLVVPRTIRLISALPGATPLALKSQREREFSFGMIQQSYWI